MGFRQPQNSRAQGLRQRSRWRLQMVIPVGQTTGDSQLVDLKPRVDLAMPIHGNKNELNGQGCVFV